ncbi:MAG: glycosyltransferase family 2 protein [Acidimicrobiales bacterium]
MGTGGTAGGDGEDSIAIPLIEACLITLNEEANMGTCLASLTGLVDTILVYDTGSTDSTADVAEASGARVVRGYWDNSFAAARNRALSLCRAEWILSIDADETIECTSIGGIRELLMNETIVRGDRSIHVTDSVTNTEIKQPVELRVPSPGKNRAHEEIVDAFEVSIHNVLAIPPAGRNTGWQDLPRVTHCAVRLFRRDPATWQGHVHERIASKFTGMPLAAVATSAFHINHSGYAISRELSNQKAKRNLELAALEAVGEGQVQEGTARAITLLKSGKAKWAARHLRQALSDLLIAADADNEHGVIAWMALKSALQVALWLDDLNTTIAVDTRLRAEFPVFPSITEGLPTNILSYMVACVKQDHVLSRIIASSFDSSACKLAIAQALNVGPRFADYLLEESFQIFNAQDDILAILAASSVVAPKLDIETARRWSCRIRASGVPDLCPLMSIANSPSNALPVRIAAARIAAHEFSDQKARLLLQSIS